MSLYSPCYQWLRDGHGGRCLPTSTLTAICNLQGKPFGAIIYDKWQTIFEP
jgi:hypothetical protein